MTGTELLVEPMLIERSFGIGEGMLYSNGTKNMAS